MIINRRRRSWNRSRLELPFVLFCCLVVIFIRVPSTIGSTLYFTNESVIDRLENKTITSVIEAEESLEALDCNSCDDRIYWTNGKEIKRSFPNASSSIELVLSHGITEPKGIAVDWRGNNVFFTDQFSEGVGSVEVVRCDGKTRRVLFREGSIQYSEAGPIVVDPHHGYIFFADVGCCIWRSNMDGSDPKSIVGGVSEVTDMAMDYITSMLYWVDSGVIYTSDYNGQGKTTLSVVDTSIPSGVSVNDGTLYWTQKRTEGANGAIYSYLLLGGVDVAEVIGNNSSLNPNDISAFVSKEVIASVTGGCSNDNGGCSHFCFTIPSPSDPLSISADYKCQCRTGFTLNDDEQTCINAPLKFLLVGHQNYINLISFDIPNEDILLPLPISSTGIIEYITYDRSNDIIYWSQRNPPAIYQSKLNGGNYKAVVTNSIALPKGLVVSDDGKNLYWVDSSIDKIEVISMASNAPHPRRTLVDTGLDHPIGLTINETIGYIYWTDTGSITDGLVEQAAKDGTHRSRLYQSAHLPGPIAIDHSTGKLYWFESETTQLGIYATDPTDGVTTRRISELNSAVGLAVLDGTLYWSDRTDGQLLSIVLNEVVHEGVSVATGLGRVGDVTAANTETPSVITNCSTNNGDCEEICVVSNNEHGRSCLCRDHFIPDPTDERECVEERTAQMIIASNVSINVFEAASGNSKLNSLRTSLPVVARSIDIDYTEQTLYWISETDGHIYRGDLSNFTGTLVTGCCYGYVRDLAVDWWGRNLYWTDSINDVIWVSKLDGSNKHILASGQLLHGPSLILVDPYMSNLYFVNNDGTMVCSLAMNGEGSMNILATYELPIQDLTLDVSNHLLYWIADSTLYGYDLLRSIEITSLVLLDDFPDRTLLAYVYDEETDKIFVKQKDVVMDYDVAEHKLKFGFVLPGSSAPEQSSTAMILNHYSVQPDVHQCTKTNGDCDGIISPLCLVTDHYDRVCKCAATDFITFNYDPNRQVCHYSCTGTNSFLLLATKFDVFHLSVRNPALNIPSGDINSCSDNHLPASTSELPTANKLPFGNIGSVQAITYDPLTQRLFWVDGKSNRINSITLSGDDRQIVGEYTDVNAVTIDYDWTSDTLVWSEDYSTRISATTTDGRASGVIYEYPFSLSDVWLPTRLAVYPRNSDVYWTRSGDFSLNKINMASLTSSRVLTGKLQIKLLTIEPSTGTLFWYNNYTRIIESYDTQSPPKHLVNVKESDKDKITAMAASTVDEHVFLFWYNESDWSVYYYNTTGNGTMGVYLQLEPNTVLVSMTAHDNSNKIPLYDEECSKCSHFCGVSPDSQSTCSCPTDRTLVSGTECSDLQCEFGVSCDDNSTCYNDLSRCDGIKDCDDASDEAHCPDYCGFGSRLCTSGICKSLNDFCRDCEHDSCSCSEGFFQCTVESLGLDKCLSNDLKCDGEPDCEHGIDETDCPTTPTQTSHSPNTVTSQPTLSPSTTNASISNALVSVIAVLGAIAVLVALGICAIAIHCLVTRRSKDTMEIHVDAYSMKTTSSPQHSPVHSICTSDISINTVVTGSTNVDKTSQEARLIKRLSTLSTDPSNPPNSPITRRSLAFTLGDEMSEFDAPIPRVPNPSLDYDAISEGMSSVSQRKYPGVISTTIGIPRIDEDHGESPPPPYFHHHPPSMYEQESLDTAYKDYCPPVSHGWNMNNVHMDEVSESTFPMTVNTNTRHQYECNGYLSSVDKSSHVIEGGGQGQFLHPYDRPPPPSPVTEYSIHGD